MIVVFRSFGQSLRACVIHALFGSRGSGGSLVFLLLFVVYTQQIRQLINDWDTQCLS